MFFRFKQFTVTVALAVFVFISIFGAIFQPEPAYAMPVEVTADAPRSVSDILVKFRNILEIAALNGAFSAVSYFTRKIAYDMAVGLASGNWGQTPLAHNTSWGKYLKTVGDEAAGLALEELGQAFGLNLCKIPDIRLDLALRIGLGKRFNPDLEKPLCTFSSAWGQWYNKDNWKSQYGSKDALDKRFNRDFRVEQTDFGIAVKATEKINNQAAQQTAAAAGQRQEDQGAKGVTDLIGGDIKTPGQVVKKQFEDTSPSEQQKMSQGQLNSALGAAATAGAEQLIPSVLSTFLNTYISLKLDRLLNGILPSPAPGGNVYSPGDYGSIPSNSGRQAAQNLFSTELNTATSNIITNGDFDLLSQLFACPESGSYGPFNCAIDQGLFRVIQKGNYGSPPAPSTIAEALADDSLHGKWNLIPPSNEVSNSDRNCRNTAYCYGNIKVLRLARILPVGFEIAASLSNPDAPWTLAKVVAGFDDCLKLPDGSVQYDPVNHPFCHLIDPNWVIKLPVSKCGDLAYGASPLISGVPDRLQECVNLQSCVGTNPDGSCNAYGYCTREKNVWRFDAKTCDSQYATCKIFTSQITGAESAFLYRTLDATSCNQDTVGCTAYSLNQDNNYNWQTPSNSNTKIFNNGVYFNNKLATTACSANSAGCSAFTLQTPAGSNTSVNLKKAPDYFNCYYSNPANPVWPATDADLARLRPKAECGNYASACIADEVGCSWFTPVSYVGGQLPGKFTPATFNQNNQLTAWNDQCDAKCVGYASYRELDSNYANGIDPAYIIPPSIHNNTAQTCTAEEKGCTGFTNLNQNVGQTEKVEYYAYLRACIKPDPARQKNFYTYEGTITEGFQLKTFSLVRDTDGGPKYFYRTDADLVRMQDSCNATVYNNHTADSDCRQFNDDQGTIFYRLLSQTIVVSSECTDYRLNNTDLQPLPPSALAQDQCSLQKGFWNNDHCELCFQNGEYRDGFCFYSGLPDRVANNAGVSRSCSAVVDSCRAYKGNTGNNTEIMFTNNFENSSVPEAIAGWSNALGSMSVSVESTHAGEHSLGFAGAGKLQKTLDLSTNEDYSLTFWAKGDGQNVSVSFNESANSSFGSISIGDTWRLYRLGPIKLTGAGDNARLVFTTAVNGRFFLDNVELTKVRSLIYLVKKSLAVDPICDSNLNDNLPGEALGCAEYSTAQNQSFYLTNFSRLCREGAVGCIAVFDTFNTAEQKNNIYNLWLPGASGTQAKITLSGGTAQCLVPNGDTGCYVKSIIDAKVQDVLVSRITTGNPAVLTNNNPRIIDSTIVIPADTPTSTPVYLVANRESVCNQADLGCTLAGVKTETPAGTRYATTTIKNDPANYDQTLCTGEAVGCSAFNSTQGNYYFKDPVAVGQKVCAYREGVQMGSGTEAKGWFWKGVGRCDGVATGSYCTADSDCAAGVTCKNKDAQPCYPDYNLGGNEFGIWSAGSTGKYKNFIGECPSTQDQCAEFVDKHDNDKSYYLINDKNFAGKSDQCSSQISERQGCILLDNTELPNKLWGTEASYAASANNSYHLTQPVGVAFNDANTIVKVTRDRECAEWGYCQSYSTVIDPSTGQKTFKCDNLGLCSESGASRFANSLGNCLVDVSATTDSRGQPLDLESYFKRDISWRGREFSGFSVFNSYNLVDLTALRSSATRQYYLVYSSGKANACVVGGVPQDGRACGPLNSGWCLAGECVYPAANNASTQNGGHSFAASGAEALACRAYPEKSSPFQPEGVLIGEGGVLDRQFKQGFENVNLCETGNCDCNYAKIAYGDNQFQKYFSTDTSTWPSVCYGGAQGGQSCSDVATILACTNRGGTCLDAKTRAIFTGWDGYCLERDVRRKINGTDQNACLSWWPKDTVAGGSDIFSENTKAGYTDLPPDTNAYMCLQSSYGNYLNNNKISVDIDQSEFADQSSFFDYSSLSNLYDDTTNGVYSSSKLGGGLLPGDYNASAPKERDRFGIWSQVLQAANGPGAPLSISARRDDIMFLGCRYYHNSIVSDGTPNRYSELGEVNQNNAKFVGNDIMFCPFTDGSFNGGVDTRRGARQVWNQTNNFAVVTEDLNLDNISQIDVLFDQDGSRVDNFTQPDFIYITPNLFVFRPMKQNDGRFNMNGAVSADGYLPNGYQPYVKLDAVQSSVLPSCGDRSYWQLSVCSMEGRKSQCTNSDPDTGGVNYGLDKICGYTQELMNDSNNFYKEVPTDDSHYIDNSLMARVIIDADNNVQGVQVIIGDENNNNDPESAAHIGFEIAVHLKEKVKCEDVVQISRAQAVDSGLSSSKPVTWRLRQPDLSLPSPWGTPPAIFNEGKRSPVWPVAPFGLMDQTAINSSSLPPTPALFINPFDYYNQFTPFTPSNRFLSGIYASLAQAGVPLRINAPGRPDPCTSPTNCGMKSFGDTLYNHFLTMFRKIYGHWVYSATERKYIAVDSPTIERDYATDAAVTTPPQIAAVDMTSCPNPTIHNQGCGIAKLNSFTVNSAIDKDIIGFKNFNVAVRFYAWADPAQMPLRRVAVDPGNGDQSRSSAVIVKNSFSAFGNYKPFCNKNACTGSGGYAITCEALTDCSNLQMGNCGIDTLPTAFSPAHQFNYFGNTTATGCQSQFMEFNMNYTCSLAGIDDTYKNANGTINIQSVIESGQHLLFNKSSPGTSGHLAMLSNNPTQPYEIPFTDAARSAGLSAGSVVCAYQPRVQVLDNWGWCSGKCNSSAGCYSERINGTVKTNECQYGLNSVLPTTASINPWVNFGGGSHYVIVAP
ncbi:MAG: hypothetical protein Q7S66_01125 [bacterium]|nr:hypothetical protein [bacterium]